MAIVEEFHRFETSLVARARGLFAEMSRGAARRRVYRKTYNELSGLSDRDLMDLGIARSTIRALARQAASDI